MKVLIVDNLDSFTFNLSQLVEKLTATEPLVIRNTEDRWRGLLRSHSIAAIILSPGPGSPARPADIGICLDVIREASVPVLGVCLGHQGIGYAYGARVVPAPEPMHGRVSRVTHDGSALFEGIPRSFDAVRYHSLCVERKTIPSCLMVSAVSPDGVAMALQHSERLQFGVQFHPESVCAELGDRLLRNFLGLVADEGPSRPSVRPMRRRPAVGLRKRLTRTARRESMIVTRTLSRWIEPQTAFERLYSTARQAFWLDSSAVIPGYSRYSAIGDASGPDSAVLLYSTRDRRLSVHCRGKPPRQRRVESLLPELRSRLSRPVQLDGSLGFGFQTGLVGYLGYEMRNELGSPTCRASGRPDALLFDTDRCVVFDHREQSVVLVSRVERPADAKRWFARTELALSEAEGPRRPQRTREKPIVASLADGPATYSRKIRECQRQLSAGESYQICLSSEISVDCDVRPLDAYRRLRALNPAPYAAFLRFGDHAVLSSSPERFLRVKPDRSVSAKPIKGTSARGVSPTEDAKLAEWLRTDEKSRAENLMIVDLLRNDIGRVASCGSVSVPMLMEVESYPTLHQLVSTVTGRLRPDRDCMDCLAAAFPGGSMTGAPKIRTMSIIDRLEQRARGTYSGALGFLSYGDWMDLSIVIRTICMASTGITVASGGGIVSLSDPRAEFDEMVLKARAPLRALAESATGDADAWEIRHSTP